MLTSSSVHIKSFLSKKSTETKNFVSQCFLVAKFTKEFLGISSKFLYIEHKLFKCTWFTADAVHVDLTSLVAEETTTGSWVEIVS